MVGLIVRLRFAMWRTAMSRSALHLVSSVLGGLAALGVLVVLGPGLVLLSQRPLRITALTVPLFTVITLMWTVLSLIATGVDSILDPARFSVLPLRAGELARGLLAAACTGIPAVMLSGLGLAQVGSWAGYPAAVPAALLGAVLGVLTAILLSRAVTSALARVMTTPGRAGPRGRGRVGGHAHPAHDEHAAHDRVARRRPELVRRDAVRRRRVVDPVRLGLGAARSTSPPGGGRRSSCTWRSRSPFVAVLYAGLGAPAGAHAHLAAHQLRRPADRPGAAAAGAARHLARRPRSPPAGCGAWYRDSRLVGIALRTFVLPVFFVVQAVFTGTPGLAGVGIVTLAVFAGLTLMNDLAFDGPAWWLHVAVGRARLGGPARPRDRLDRGLRAGRRAHLRRERGARRHLATRCRG